MRPFILIVGTSIRMALRELAANKLRSFLSLLGVTIGIFCIVGVSAVLDSLERNFRKSVASLGSDVIYVGKWPWTDEGGEYRWWEYQSRPVLRYRDLEAITRQGQAAGYATLCFSERSQDARQERYALGGITAYAVTPGFEKMQDFSIAQGRYFSKAELDAGRNLVVLGYEVATELFPGTTDPTGRTITTMGKKLSVVGVLRKYGNNMAGFNFDRGIILPFFTASSVRAVTDPNADITLMIKARPGISTDDLSAETEGILRAQHRIRPGADNDFSINRLSQITDQLDNVFVMIDLVGLVIAAFSLLVGAFGIANIMFVSVKERTRMIGLKKAIGARRSAILAEFLIEAVVLCVIGGMAGIAAVGLLALVMTLAIDFPVSLSLKNVGIGLCVATTVGLLAGYIPARAAAAMDPVVAIRST